MARPPGSRRRRPPSWVTEATVAGELYHRARLAGLLVGLEVRAWRGMRADVVFMRERSPFEPFALVEVKRGKSVRERRGRQSAKYDSTGVPWRYCEGMDDVQRTVSWAVELARAGEI